MIAGASAMEIYVMPLDHSIQRLPIYSEHTRCRLFVPARVLQHAGDVAPLNLRQLRPVLFRRAGDRLDVCLSWLLAIFANAFRQILNSNYAVAHRASPYHRVLQLAYVSGPRVSLEQGHSFRRESNGGIQ